MTNGKERRLQGALAHHQAGRWPEAERAYRKVLAAEPGLFEAHVNLGVVLQEQDRPEDAAQSYRQAIAINPELAEVHFALATALQALDRDDDAVACFQCALEIKPGYAEALNGLAITRQKQGDAADAIETFERALEADPRSAGTHNNLGTLYHKEGRLEDAMDSFRRAIEIAPDYAEAHRNYSQVLLLAGRLDEGWRESRWRWKCGDFPSKKREFPYPLWSGEPLKGKRILVWGEQGVGDEVHFAGMVPDLIGQGAHVILESEHRLVPLFQRSFADAECIPRRVDPGPETNRDDIDFQAPSGDLGQWLRPGLDAFPDRRSFLVAEEGRVGALKAQYRDGGDDLLVGIAWSSKSVETAKQKTVSLTDWRPLAGVPGVRFVDLQYGDTGAERAAFEAETGVRVIHDDAIDQLTDLDAFAAQVAAMDLVISVTNTTVYMAGGLGVPTWVLMSDRPLWVWMQDREDSPWYPSLRLFRQTRSGAWDDVIGRVAEAFPSFAGGA